MGAWRAGLRTRSAFCSYGPAKTVPRRPTPAANARTCLISPSQPFWPFPRPAGDVAKRPAFGLGCWRACSGGVELSGDSSLAFRWLVWGLGLLAAAPELLISANARVRIQSSRRTGRVRAITVDAGARAGLLRA